MCRVFKDFTGMKVLCFSVSLVGLVKTTLSLGDVLQSVPLI